ncbi:SAM-dependent methyltransferase [Calidifontibacter terrae]
MAAAWQDALYGPDGFYQNAQGPAAHFATSTQGIPGVVELLAELVIALARRENIGRIVDFACGRGELLHQLRLVDPTLDLTGVDIVERPTGLVESIGWVRSPGGGQLPTELDNLTDTLLLAHEWLDVVPCDLLVDDHLMTADGSLGTKPSSTQRNWATEHWPTADPAEVVELGDTRDAAYAALRGRLSSGLFVCVDYGHLAGERPPVSTLTGFRDGRECEPRFDGSTDITAHVAMDSLGADELIRQADLANTLILRPERPDHSLAQRDPLAYIASLRRRGAWSAFTDPAGLGGFWWSLERVSSRSSGAAKR